MKSTSIVTIAAALGLAAFVTHANAGESRKVDFSDDSPSPS
jgi:hypothetical protein